jgi:hypothetical protein
MGMALAGNASAVLLWLVCLKGTGLLTRYTNSKCLEANPKLEGEWQSLGVPAGVSITVEILVLSIKLADTKTAIGTSGAECLNNEASRGLGLIEAKGKGKILTAEVKEPEKNCKGVGGCKATKVKKLEGANLPWETEIFESEGKPLTKISAHSGGGAPGWKVECENILNKIETDECLEESGHPEQVRLTLGEVTENPEKVKELLVRALFEERGEAKCTVGGAKAGKVLGTLAILLPGGALSINS